MNSIASFINNIEKIYGSVISKTINTIRILKNFENEENIFDVNSIY